MFSFASDRLATDVVSSSNVNFDLEVWTEVCGPSYVRNLYWRSSLPMSWLVAEYSVHLNSTIRCVGILCNNKVGLMQNFLLVVLLIALCIPILQRHGLPMMAPIFIEISFSFCCSFRGITEKLGGKFFPFCLLVLAPLTVIALRVWKKKKANFAEVDEWEFVDGRLFFFFSYYKTAASDLQEVGGGRKASYRKPMVGKREKKRNKQTI